MSGRIVCDASAVVAMLLDGGNDGAWAARELSGGALHAPHLMTFEVANIVRKAELAGDVTPSEAAQAHADLIDLPVELWPYDTIATCSWNARQTLTIYDAAYVALAALLDAPLVTLDARVARAPDLPCAVKTC